MKKLLIATTMLGLTAALLLAQGGTVKIHTQPALPSGEALERMGLTLAWRTRLLLGGNRDGIATIQLFPWTDHPQLFVQTYSGRAALFDAETGDLVWQVQVGKPYMPAFPGGSNSNSIFVGRRTVLYVLNRANGVNRLYSLDSFTGLKTDGIEMPYMATAAPVADENALYFVMSTKAVVFRLPVYGAKGEALRHILASGEEGEPVLPEAGLLYNVSDEFVGFPPLVAGNQFTVVTSGGSVISLNRFEQKPPYEYSVDGNVVAMPGQHGTMAYIGTARGTLFAIDMETTRQAWRFYPGGDIRMQPAVLDRDVFVAADRVGLLRVDRTSGQEVWLARGLDRFLSANEKFVYALDRRGELHVLDYMRGGTLARYDLKDWTVPVLNELTDRIYLAANDGQIMCLRHRDQREPLHYRVPPAPKKVKKKDEKKDEMEDKKDEKKDDKKDDKAGWNLDRPRPDAVLLARREPAMRLGAALPMVGDHRRRLP